MVRETSWTRPASNGTMPDARCAHTTVESYGKLFIFGGWNGRSMLNDLHVLYPG